MAHGITQSYLPPGRGSIYYPYPGCCYGRYLIYPQIKDEKAESTMACDPIQHVSSHSGDSGCKLQYSILYLTLLYLCNSRRAAETVGTCRRSPTMKPVSCCRCLRRRSTGVAAAAAEHRLSSTTAEDAAAAAADIAAAASTGPVD